MISIEFKVHAMDLPFPHHPHATWDTAPATQRTAPAPRRELPAHRPDAAPGGR